MAAITRNKKINTTIKTFWQTNLEQCQALANFIVIESNKAILQKGYFTIALSGGSTPKLLFEILAQPNYDKNINWKNVIIAFADERFVEPTSTESNFKLANDALLKKVSIPKKNILAVKTVNITPAKSAQLYEEVLRKHISATKPFDLVLLGIGEEGHTASIFPNSKLLTCKNWVQHIWVEEKQMERISFTLSFINKATNVAFLVSGKNKAAIIKKVFSASGKNLPAALVNAKQHTYWFLDIEANGN